VTFTTGPDNLENAALARLDIQGLVREHLDFVWRSLRRLGVRDADCDDGCQRVWMVLARHQEHVVPSKERSFVFSVVLRIASEMRRGESRQGRWEELDDASQQSPAGETSDPERCYERRRGLEKLDALLSTMSFELRDVFVMFELEGFSSVEIAQQLGVSRGTVASRLRLARESFQGGLARLRLRENWPKASGE
jgi:RNA polymerase sigma-70 factor, ECF subfamily